MSKILTSIISVLVVAFFLSGCAQKGTQTTTSIQIQQSGPIKCNDAPCLGQNFPSCTPAEVTMSANGQSVKISILGLVNEKCHFTMVFGSVTAADCYFKKENLNGQVLNQMFGNKEGQDAVIAEACKQ